MVLTTYALGFAIATWTAIVDLRTHRLPNHLVTAIGAVGAVGLAVASLAGGASNPLHLAAGVAAFAGPWFVLNLVSPASVGFGDVKFACALGLYLGWIDPALGFVASVATVVLAWPQSVLQVLSRSSPVIPLGPYLLGGAAVAVAIGA